MRAPVLAINGGRPVRENLLPYNQPKISRSDYVAIESCLHSGNIAGNTPMVRNFERAIADFTGYKFAIAVNSATSGLFTAYSFLGNDSGFPWVVPSLTFIATANMMVAAGQKFRLFDSGERTLTCEVIGNCCVSVSYAGYPVKVGAVADDAHYLYANMAEHKRHKVSVISTHAIKNLTTAEGGVILTDDESLYREMSAFVDHGRGNNKEFAYGFNFRMPAINAALGLSQLQRAGRNYSRRQGIATHYRTELKDIPFLEMPPDHERHSYHLFVVRVRDKPLWFRDWFRDALEAEGIGTQIHYPPVYSYSHIQETLGYIDFRDYPVTEDVWWNGVSLPMSAAMTYDDSQDVINAIHKIAESI